MACGSSLPPDRDCDVWLVLLADFAPCQPELDALLSAADREAVGRRRGDDERALSRLSRAMLRLLLARYLDADPRALAIDRTCPTCSAAHGKPRLHADSTLHFSVAHCRDLLLVAFRRGAPVGVDVESLQGRSGLPSAELLTMTLAPPERSAVASASPADQWPRFLRYWTLKESVLKMTGAGLATPLSEVIVPDLADGGQVQLAGARDSNVWARPLDVGPSYVAAIATLGAARVARVRRPPVAVLARDTETLERHDGPDR